MNYDKKQQNILAETNRADFGNELLETALKYAEAGYKIFPVQENGKLPTITKNGFLDATKDINQIKKWWWKNPNLNIGLPMAPNGLVAIDIDRHKDKDGFINFENHCLIYGLSDLPETVEAITAGNGKHKIFKVPDDFKPAGKLTDNVDIKYNGYILVEPSKINSNQYEWITDQGLLDMNPAELPDNWIKHLICTESSQIFAVGGEYPSSNAEKVAEKCNFIKHCIDDSLTLSEPDWKFGLIGVISFCENGIEYAHKWSENHAGYNFKETNKKINDTLAYGRPMTCQGIEKQCRPSQCENCKLKGKIKSPIILGYNRPEPEIIKEDLVKIEFPLDALPEDVRLLTENASRVMDAPNEFVACSILSGASILLSSKAEIAITESWKEPSILWSMLVAKPSLQAKSPSFKIMKNLIDEIDNGLISNYQNLKEKYETELAVYDKELKLWKNQKDAAALPEKPERPFRELIYTSDTTTESLKDLQNKNSRGVAIVNDEISSFLRSLNQYKKGGNDEQYFLSAWNADKFIYSRKGENGSNEPVTVKPYHNIFGTTQPSEVEKLLLTDINSTNGFSERWLYCLSDHERNGFISREELDKNLLEKVKTAYTKLYNIEETCYTFDSEASKIFDEIHKEYFDIIKLPTTSNLLKSYLSKQNSYIARLAMILHCLENPHIKEIGAVNVIRAVKLSNYFISCFKKLSKISVDMKNNILEDYALEWMKTKSIYEISPSNLFLSNKCKFKNSDDAKDVLLNLAQKGYGETVQQGRGLKFILKLN